MTKTVSAKVNNDLHEKLVDICNHLGKTVNELLNDWIKEQSDLMIECITKNKTLMPQLVSNKHLGKTDNIDRTNLEKWVKDLNKIKVENV